MRNILNEMPDVEATPRLQESLKVVLATGVKGKKVLDIGCGNANTGGSRPECYSEGVDEVVGIEITEKISSWQGVTSATNGPDSWSAEFSVSLVTTVVSTSSSLGSSWSTSPSRPRLRCSKEVSRVLKPGGMFFMSTRGGMWGVCGFLNMYIWKWICRRPPILGDTFVRRERREYARNDGLATIFGVFAKPNG
jgi:hypothetical protein